MTRDRVTVQEAARRLGVKDDAIRKRIQRGTIETEKDEDGRVYVYLDATHYRAHDGCRDSTQHAAHDAGTDGLAEVLREEVAYLRGMIETRDRELETRAEELRRKDHIIAGLVERIPELPPSPATTAGAETATANGTQGPRQEARDGHGGTAARPPQAPEASWEAQTATQRPPWWLRWLGG